MSDNDQKNENDSTSCFTYEVSMIVQVLAKDKEEADNKLESEGGFVSKRSTEFKDMVAVYSGEKSLDKKTSEEE
jgi:hypothetical protein